MREYKFRGKRLDNGEWVEGDLVRYYENQRRFIACDQLAYTYTECGIDRLVSERYHEVNPDTVGQYTGIKDANGVDVYDGDIIKDTHESIYNWEPSIFIGAVEWSAPETTYKATNGSGDYIYLSEAEDFEVIGNRWDNPDLLEGGPANA